MPDNIENRNLKHLAGASRGDQHDFVRKGNPVLRL